MFSRRSPRANPFYLSIKRQGHQVERLGPMSEADFWIEDMTEEGLVPLFTSADPDVYEIGKLLKDRRMALGLSLNQVAEMAEISKSYLNDIELGKVKRPSRSLHEYIAKMLDAYFEGPMPQRKKNPGELTEADIEHYRFFHGVPPDEYIDLETWVPGEMVLIGSGKDVGYGIQNKHSKKEGWYVHDFGPSVKIYQRARSGQRPDRIWKSFPSQLTNLGYNLGFTYIGTDGEMKEVKGAQNKYLAVTPSRRTLVIVGPKGVEYLMEGGEMRVDDWIRD